MKLYLLTALILAVASSCLHPGCKKEPPVVPPPPTTVKDPRTYTWTVDTLAYPGSMGTSMTSIWGSSPTNVYVVGHSEVNGGHMWHFDGNRWSFVRLATQQGGTIPGGFDLERIHGFSANDIWVVGSRSYYIYEPWPPVLVDSSFIMHFDGQQWRELQIQRTSGGLQAIGGSTPNDFWTGGWSGVSAAPLYRIRNRKAELYPMNRYVWFASFAGESPSNMHAMAYEVDRTMPIDSVYHYYYRFNGLSWDRIQTYLAILGAPSPTFGISSLWINPTSGLLFSSGDNGIFQLSYGVWQSLLFTSEGIVEIDGNSGTNYFAVGTRRAVFHSNGKDWQALNAPRELVSPGVYFSSVWTDGTEAFIVGTDGGKSYVLHGK